MLGLGHVGAAGREGWSLHLEKLVEIGRPSLGGAILVVALVGFNNNYCMLPTLGFRYPVQITSSTELEIMVCNQSFDSHGIIEISSTYMKFCDYADTGKQVTGTLHPDAIIQMDKIAHLEVLGKPLVDWSHTE